MNHNFEFMYYTTLLSRLYDFNSSNMISKTLIFAELMMTGSFSSFILILGLYPNQLVHEENLQLGKWTKDSSEKIWNKLPSKISLTPRNSLPEGNISPLVALIGNNSMEHPWFAKYGYDI